MGSPHPWVHSVSVFSRFLCHPVLDAHTSLILKTQLLLGVAQPGVCCQNETGSGYFDHSSELKELLEARETDHRQFSLNGYYQTRLTAEFPEADCTYSLRFKKREKDVGSQSGLWRQLPNG